MRQTILTVLSLSAIAALLTGCGGDLVLLNSKGPVAEGLSGLMMTAIYLMLLVVVPSIIMALWFSWKYRASNKDADYKPTWAHSTAIEIVVWGVPIILIAILAWMAWWGSHQYDPYRPLDAESDKKTLDIQVIAEPFKWVFVYPEQEIATINEVRFPAQTPVHFHITSDFTMNSFFIPQLAGQIYAMAGMQTHLHVLANEPGIFRGFSANYSGYGFSQMRFKAHSVTQPDFDKWVSDVKAGKGTDANADAIQTGNLDLAVLQSVRDGERSHHQIEGMLLDAKTPKQHEIAEEAERLGPYPDKPTPVTYYSSVEPDLFKKVINKYMSNYHGSKGSSHANMQHAASAGE